MSRVVHRKHVYRAVPCPVFGSFHFVGRATGWSTDDVVANLVNAGDSRLQNWGPKDPPTDCLKNLRDMAANHEQWLLCRHFLSNQNDCECAFMQLDCIMRVGYHGIFFSPHPCRLTPSSSCIFILVTVTFNSYGKAVISGACCDV